MTKIPDNQSSEPPIINQKKLVRLFRDSIKQGNNTAEGVRFCFLIGAGASKDSDIKTGKELATDWYKEITEDLEPEELRAWKTEKGIDEKNLAASYPQIFEKRFEDEAQFGYDELQLQMKKSDPSIGYMILARILAETRHNFVITTNFDHLIEDALFTATPEHPLICGHESLAAYIQSQSQRPTIIKVHRDLLLTPFNKTTDTKKLKDEWIQALAPVLKDFRLVVIGYGANDGSLMDYLTTIKEEHRRKIFWCVRNPKNINQQVREVLKGDDTLVQIEGFEELMYELNDACGLDSFIDLDDLENSQLIENARDKVKHYKKKLTQLAERAKQQVKEGKVTLEALKKLLPNWWAYENKVSQENSFYKKEIIYKEGIKAFPNSHELIGNYAVFLDIRKKDYEQAEFFYLKALEVASADSINYGNYANFLKNIKKNFDQAEPFYLKALKENPENAYYNGNYACFLLALGQKEKGSTYLEKAFLLEPADDLLSELWFYKLAHFPNDAKNARKELDTLLANGVTSPGWDFSLNIERAKKDGCEYIEELEDYAKKISRID